MNYQLVEDIRYRASGNDPREIVIRKGSVVRGVSRDNVSFADKLMINRVTAEARKSNVRYGFFLAYGVVRYAAMVDKLMPTRRQPNVSTV